LIYPRKSATIEVDKSCKGLIVEGGKPMEKVTAKPEPEREMKTYIFKVAIEEDPFDDGKMAYHAYCPSLKGVSTWGYAKEKAMENIREVVEMTVESMIEHGESIPEEPGVQVFSEPRVAITI
jgi:predicted RNase H-like HicB family nuclease